MSICIVFFFSLIRVLSDLLILVAYIVTLLNFNVFKNEINHESNILCEYLNRSSVFYVPLHQSS